LLISKTVTHRIFMVWCWQPQLQ